MPELVAFVTMKKLRLHAAGIDIVPLPWGRPRSPVRNVGARPHKGACKGENTDWAFGRRDEAWEEEQLSTRRELSKKLLKVTDLLAA